MALEAPRVQGRSEEPVVDDRNLVVDGFDEGALDDGRGQRSRLRIGTEILVGIPLEKSHAGNRQSWEAAGSRRSGMVEACMLGNRCSNPATIPRRTTARKNERAPRAAGGPGGRGARERICNWL